MITCMTALMMMPPPGLPSANHGRPSLSTIVGVIEESGRLRGWTALASLCTSP